MHAVSPVVPQLMGPRGEVVFVDAAEHFFEGKLSEVQAAIRNWVQQLLKPGKHAEAS